MTSLTRHSTGFTNMTMPGERWRLAAGDSGGQSPTGPHNLDQPYTMAYEHDAFGHITSKTGYYYSSQDDNSYSYTNNRASNWNYDSTATLPLTKTRYTDSTRPVIW